MIAERRLAPQMRLRMHHKGPLCKGGSVRQDGRGLSFFDTYNPSVCAYAQTPPFTQGRLSLRRDYVF